MKEIEEEEEINLENTTQQQIQQTQQIKKNKTLHDPTESMLASQREFERRKNEIKPEDDPFWEKRGGKCSKIFIKFNDLPEKPQKSLKECVEQILPLPNNSRLLTPTQATLLLVYHKENIIKEKHITNLPNNSHLLTPTRSKK